MTIGALSLGGMTLSWQWPQYRYWNMMMRGAAAAAPASGRESGAPAAAVAPVSGRRGSAPAALSAGGAVAAGGAARVVLAPSELPYIPEGYGPEELATRTRIQFPGLGVPPEEWAEAQSRLPWAAEDAAAGDAEGEDIPGVEDAKSAAEVAEDSKCKTCEERKYKDGSDDPGVSFKTATRVDPRGAQAAVRGHEMEHVFRERAKAEREGRKVVGQSVTYHTGICPECGKFYISGGTTRTVTAADNSKEFFRKRYAGGEGDTDLGSTA